VDPNYSEQEAHDGAVLQSSFRGYDLADAGSHRIFPVPPIVPSAMILSPMIVVGQQSLSFILCLVIIEPLAVNGGLI
jgi:hypothetical protein